MDEEEQILLSKQLVLRDTEAWQIRRSMYTGGEWNRDLNLRYVGGLDITYSRNGNFAVSGLLVLDLSGELKVVYEDIDDHLMTVEQEYIPGLLARRELPALLSKLNKLKKDKPELYPQCILVDGNGTLHPRKFGIACHIGLMTDTPTIGVAKSFYHIDGLSNNEDLKLRVADLSKAGDAFPLYSNDELYAFCYRSSEKSRKPVYVSLGHKIGWETALWLLRSLRSQFRIPEPIRKADIETRRKLHSLLENQ